jgi:hypothetical protein
LWERGFKATLVFLVFWWFTEIYCNLWCHPSHSIYLAAFHRVNLMLAAATQAFAVFRMMIVCMHFSNCEF